MKILRICTALAGHTRQVLRLTLFMWLPVGFAGCDTEGQINPGELRCDDMVAPLGIDHPQPRLSWILKSDARNQSQSAYRILVASSDSLLKDDKADVWDSGKVSSDDQLGIVVPVKLRPLSRYFWKVQVWDRDGKPGAWSPVAPFETGFFDLSEWRAPWIQPFDFVVHYARKPFAAESGKAVERARVYVAAAGGGSNTYVFWLNGQRVGNDLYAPGPCEPIKALYSTFDVTHLLKEGTNVAGLLYNRLVSVHLQIHYKDGTVQDIVTDATWKGLKQGPYLGIGNYGTTGGGMEEIYDARSEPTGWLKNGFDDSGWNEISTIRTGANPENTFPVTTMAQEFHIYWTLKPGEYRKNAFPVTILKARKVPCVEIERFKPVAIKSLGNGKYIVDFGQNAAGHVRIKASGAQPGSKMEIHYAELLTADGMHIDQSSYWEREPHQHYIFKDDGEVEHQPLFFNVGFRYVEIANYPGELTADKIESIAVTSDVLSGSSFECSSPVINRLHDMAGWSILSNLQNIPTDCPGRERRGWTGDAHAISAGANLNFDMRNFMEKWMDDHAECQYPSGWIPVELPMNSDGHIDIRWPVSSIFIPWDLYQAYGDSYFLERNYPMMVKYMNFLRTVSDSTHTPRYGDYGDWVALEKAGNRFLLTAYYYRCASLMANIADVLGFTTDAALFSDLSAAIRESILKTFRHSHGDSLVYFDNNTQSANVHALGFRIPVEGERGQVLNSIIADYQDKGHNTAGFLGIRWTLPVLSEGGRNDIAYSLVKNDTVGSWLHVVNKWNATTMHEVWNTNKTYSHNHAFLVGSLTEWLYQDLAGIRSVKPGFKEIRIKPYIPDDLHFARARVNTVRGEVTSEWVKETGGTLKLNVTIPVNTSAVIHVPSGDRKRVNESASGTGTSRDVNFLRMENGYAVYSVGSGIYSFTSEKPGRASISASPVPEP